MNRFDFLVVGGGAAGFFGAIQAALNVPNSKIAILEATKNPLTKVKVSGGGRCNVTHHCFDPALLCKNYPRGEKELRQAFERFGPRDTISFFNQQGIEIIAEADGRMFPSTNKSQTIINCFRNLSHELGIEVLLGKRVESFSTSDQEEFKFRTKTKDGSEYLSKNLLLATGSSIESYSLIEKAFGHQIISPVPSLFTFKIKHPLLKDLAGTSFKKGEAHLSFDQSKKKFKQVGPILITHWGLSGPAILKLSAFGARELFDAKYQANLVVNFLDIGFEIAKKEILKAKDHSLKNSVLKNPFPELTKRFWSQVLEMAGVASKRPSEISNKEIEMLVQTLVRCNFEVSGKGIFKEEFVTCGGVKRKEIDFKRMESKLVQGLYFSGEVIDIDGITGGFNFQNAWTGSYLAAKSYAAGYFSKS